MQPHPLPMRDPGQHPARIFRDYFGTGTKSGQARIHAGEGCLVAVQAVFHSLLREDLPGPVGQGRHTPDQSPLSYQRDLPEGTFPEAVVQQP